MPERAHIAKRAKITRVASIAKNNKGQQHIAKHITNTFETSREYEKQQQKAKTENIFI